MYYVYDVPTYQYKGTSSVKVDNSTDVVPPEIKEHQCLVWNGNFWEVHEDWRGTHIYSDTGMDLGTYGAIGHIPSKYITKKPPEKRIGENLKWNIDNKDWDILLDVGWLYDEHHIPRPMTDVEMVQYGLMVLPDNMKIENNEIVMKTPYELYAEGRVTLEEANNMIMHIREEQYVLNTDKYGMMYMRGEVTLEFWQEEIQKIKDAYPYIEENNG